MSRIDEASIEILASAETLYAAFADPARLMRWLPPGTMTGQALEYDFQVGGRYRIALSYAVGSRTDVSHGRFLELEPGRRIVQSVEFESPDAALQGEMILRWTFEPTSAGTSVSVRASGVPAGIRPEDHALGMRSSLENLRRFVMEA